jgi:hypothetical protein
MRDNWRYALVGFAVVITMFAARGQAQTTSGKVLDPVQFKAEAERRTTELNNGSTDTSKRVDRTNKELPRMNKVSDDIERYNPDDPGTKKARDNYDAQFMQFVADRANDETALIQFRDSIKSARAFLKLHDQHKALAAYQGLEKALVTAERWENYVVNKWPNKEARPRRPREAISGPSPASVSGSPVLQHQRLTESGRIGVGSQRIVRYSFTNRDRTNRIWFNVRLSEADDNGNAVSRADLTIEPADWQNKSLDPGQSIELRWGVTPRSAREYAVGLQLEESRYLPVK